jgi:hypothetical protein
MEQGNAELVQWNFDGAVIPAQAGIHFCSRRVKILNQDGCLLSRA